MSTRVTTPHPFAELGVPTPLVEVLARRGIHDPFPIQAAAIADAIGGRDVSGKAPTGSGKTLAFGLPTLARLGRAKPHRPTGLVLAPTRELAEQIARELAPLAKAVKRRIHAVYGGTGYNPQRTALRRGVDLLVATPGRLEDLIERRWVDLGSVEIVIIDEADRMADMGFLPAVQRIVDQTPGDRQTLLFSATLDGAVGQLAARYQDGPVTHEVAGADDRPSEARHHFWLVRRDERVERTADLVDELGPSIVFTRTRHGADRLAKQLGRHGIDAVAMHGGRSQNQRDRALRSFASGRAQALVATDVAARGIHVDGVSGVVHFDPPADAKDYVHRSGRTARAGEEGTVVTLVGPDQRGAVRRLQREVGVEAPIGDPDAHELADGGVRIGDGPVDAGGRRDRPQGRRSHREGRTDGRAKDRRNGRDARRDARGRPARGADGQTTSIYVANLPWSTDDEELSRLFGRHGTVRDATVIADRQTGRSRGFGFVEMASDDATRAIGALEGETFGGRPLTVRIARPRRG